MVAKVSEKDPAMLFFGRDFYEDEAVRLMSLEQEAVYMRLLWHAWREGSIPASVDALAALIRMPVRRFAKLWSGIAVKWHATEDGSRLTNKRLLQEQQKRVETKQRQKEGGQAGNAKRWGERSVDRSLTDACEHRSPIASQSQSQAQEEAKKEVLPSPAGPGVLTPSSCCGPGDQRDDRAAASGPAGPSGTEPQRALLEELKRSGYRKHARHRDLAMTAASVRLDAAGITAADLLRLAQLAARRGKNPSGLFAHWIDHTDEALKELGKRP